MSNPSRPDVCTDEHLTWLDDLRATGNVNMLGCSIPLRYEFPDLTREDARAVAMYWMTSFGKETR